MFDNGDFCTIEQTIVLANNAEIKEYACFDTYSFTLNSCAD